MIILGTKVTDSVTGITGIATARAEYMTGCIRYLVECKVGKDGEAKEFWFDEVRLVPKKEKKKASSGFGSSPKYSKNI